MKSERYSVTIDVSVWDKRAVIKAARDHAEANGNKRGDIRNVSEAVQWLLDPGSLCDGAQIDGSAIDHIPDGLR